MWDCLETPLDNVIKIALSFYSFILMSLKRRVTVFSLIFFLFLQYLIFLPLKRPTLAAPPTDFVTETLIVGLDQPTAMEFLPDGRMLILERDGTIYIVQAGASIVDPTPFMQITNINIDQGERGLTGIDLDPNFATNGFFYLFYTRNNLLRDTVSRFTAVGNSASTASEQIIWQAPQTADNWHHGGSVMVGPDGRLYISTGDGFDNPNNSQSLISYQGKLLRVNTDGAVPSDNPFNDGAGSNYDFIWAMGLRNPFRISLDAPTGRIYIGDVGGNNVSTSIEEINVGVAGANYGWPVCEGSCGTAGMTNPLFSYPHSGSDASITGGFVYRGGNFPANYQGDYFYGDYVRNFVRGLDLDPVTGALNGTFNFEPSDGSVNGPYGEIVDFEQGGPDGALYYVDIGISWEGGLNPGTVRRIKYTAANQPPVITLASANPTSGPNAPLIVNFTGSATDPESQSISYSWEFGDGSPTSSEQNPVHIYQQKGSYIARLTVSDGVNQTLSNPITIVVGTPPVINLISVTTLSDQPGGQITFRAGENANFSASASDADGTLGETSYSWEVLLIHLSHTHPEAGPVFGSSGVFSIPTSGHELNDEMQFQFVLTVTDSDGLKATNAVNIIPETVNLGFDTAPTGLIINIDGFAKVTPTVLNTAINFQHTIEAPLSQGGFNFVSWSDGGAATHTIIAPAIPQSYVATYQPGVTPTPTPTPTPPPATGLLAGYAFEEGVGTTASDSSGNNRALTLAGSPAWNTTGKYGGGLNLDGSDDRGWVGSFPLPAQFTYMAWVNNPSNQAYETIATVGTLRDFYLNNGTFSFYNGSSEVGLGVNAPTGNWQHVAITYNGAQVQAYLNGVATGTPQNMGLGSITNTLQVGSWITGSSNVDFFSGVMDEVRVYNSALSQTDIQVAMNTPLSGQAPTPTPTPTSTPSPTPTPSPSPSPTGVPGLMAGYAFDEGSGAVAGDSSGNNRSLTLNGSPAWDNGQYGGGLALDGIDDRGSFASFPLPAQFTYASWISNPSNQAYETIMTVGAPRDFYLNNGLFTFYNGTSEVGLGVSSPTGSWQHIAITYNGSQIQAYLNGTPVGIPQNMNLGALTDTLQVGSWISGANNFDFFSGTVDEVRIYDRALSQTELQSVMNTPLSGMAPSPTPTPSPSPSPGSAYLSVATDGTVGGVVVANEDIVALNTTTAAYQVYFDGSDVGLAASDVDAFYIEPSGNILFSTTTNVTLAGAGAVTPQDIVRFTPISLGDTTSGTFEMYFDGSDVGLTTSSENIDAMSVLPDGRVVVSISGSGAVTGVATIQDEDMVAFTPTSLGAITSGTWLMYFDGSDVGLADTSSEDINALYVDAQGDLHLSTVGDFTVSIITGANEDLVEFVPTTLGDNTTGSYIAPLSFDGSTFGLSSFNVDGFQIR